MFFPALLAKFLAPGAVAQAATGAGVARRGGHGRQHHRPPRDRRPEHESTAVGATPVRSRRRRDAHRRHTDAPPTAAPARWTAPQVDMTVPVQPVQETFDPQTWARRRPGRLRRSASGSARRTQRRPPSAPRSRGRPSVRSSATGPPEGPRRQRPRGGGLDPSTSDDSTTDGPARPTQRGRPATTPRQPTRVRRPAAPTAPAATATATATAA